MDAETLAPLSEESRDFIRGLLEKPDASEAEIRCFADTHPGIEYRDIPRKLQIAQTIASQMWAICHMLEEEGLRFPKGLQKAADTLAATVYACWRGCESRIGTNQPEEPEEHLVYAFADGLEHALVHGEGMPKIYRDDFLDATRGSCDPIDQHCMFDGLAALWPKQFRNGEIQTSHYDGTPPVYVDPADSPIENDDDCMASSSSIFDDCMANTPSIFTDISREAAR